MKRATSKVAILDLGNVVLNWDVNRILDSLGVEPIESELLSQELFHHPDWLDLDHGKQTEAAVVQNICDRSPLKRAVIERALHAARESLSPIDETLVLMQSLNERGIAMYCLSNMSRETYSHIQNYDLFTLFEGIVISGIEGCMKPNDEIFHLLLHRFDLQPSQCVFVDDSLANIETAQRIGIDAFHFKRTPDCYTSILERLV